MKILVIDNYDSFTYNLVHILRELGAPPEVVKNDQINMEGVVTYDKILISPGPGLPKESGRMMEVIERYAPTKSILGICLGHQGIGEAFGASIYNIQNVLHGVTSQSKVVCHDDYLFQHIPSVFQCTHYHSWAVKAETMTPDLEITAINDEGLVMGLRHKKYDVRGLQFHPESIMTPDGPQMIKNWVLKKN